jgi:hypothetical protein
MSRRNKNTPKYGCTVEQRKAARSIWKSWNRAVTACTDRQGTPIPPELKSNTAPINQYSLAAAICAWVEQHPGASVVKESTNTDMSDGLVDVTQEDNWFMLFKQIIERIQDGHEFLCKGYGSCEPNIAWLFKFGKGGQRGIERILEGQLDYKSRKAGCRTEDGI